MNRNSNELKENHYPCKFVKHEWEELIDKLCNSDDPKLKEMGDRYKHDLEAKQKRN